MLYWNQDYELILIFIVMNKIKKGLTNNFTIQCHSELVSESKVLDVV